MSHRDKKRRLKPGILDRIDAQHRDETGRFEQTGARKLLTGNMPSGKVDSLFTRRRR